MATTTARRFLPIGIGILCCAIATLLICAFVPTPAQAMYQQQYVKGYKSGTHRVILENPYPGSESGKLANTIEIYGGKFSKLKNSKKKVAKARLTAGKTNVQIKLKKAGKTTIKFKCKGKTYKHKYIVYKYKNPAAKFMLGDEDITAKYATYSILDSYGTLKDKKLQVTAAPGWKIKLMKVTDNKGERTVKNGDVLQKKDDSILIVFKSTTKKKLESVLTLYKGKVDF